MEETVIDLPETGNQAEESLTNADDSNPWSRPPADEPESKKRKIDVTSDSASKRRGQRMFGVLMGTLNQFKKEGKRETQSDAAKRRTAIEEKLATKLRAETEENERKASRNKTERSLKLDVLRKEEEKFLLDAIYKKRQTAALNMANFLCTSVPSTNSAENQPNPSLAARAPLVSSLPLHSNPAHNLPPVYYLPAKLLPSQTATLADQAAAAKKAVDNDREDWADESRTREEEFVTLRAKRDEALEEIAREERADRIRRERDAGDADEDEHPLKKEARREMDLSPRRPVDQEMDDSQY